MTKTINNSAYKITVFGTDDKSFRVTATLLTKNNRGYLINTGFTKDTAEEIADYLTEQRVKLEGVFILHGDPDYYFGLETIVKRFPDVVAYATKETTEHIARTVTDKLEVWSGQLKEKAPDNIVLPKIHGGKNVSILGENFELIGSDSTRINLWDEKNKVLLGGIDVFNEIHLFLADTGNKEQLERWVSRVPELERLGTKTVVPSHGDLNASFDEKALVATKNYLQFTISILESGNITDKLLRKYPGYQNKGVVELGAKVLTGEISWGTTPYPGLGKHVIADFSPTVVFDLDFTVEGKMTFVGTDGVYKGYTDTVEPTIIEVEKNVFMVYWAEENGIAVVHVQNWNNNVVYTNIFTPDDKPATHLKGTLSLM